MASTNLFIRSKLLSSNMLTRFRPASRFFCNNSFGDYDGLAPNGKITSFVLYLNTAYQTMSFLTNFNKFCPLQGILLHVLSFTLNYVRFSC
ncbi:hypothetical protein Hanom_Chr16g01450181 [Helianthus anomalus]